MKVIFLDFDGVLNCEEFFKEVYNNKNGKYDELKKYSFKIVDERKIIILSEIVKITGAKVVISSSWRWDWKDGIDNLEFEASKYIQSLFDKYDIDIIGITPKVAGGNGKRSSNSWRENEIKEYLSTHEDIESFCVIDDDIEDLETLRNYLITTSFNKTENDDGGLQESHINEAVKILNRKRNIKIY